MQNVDSKKLIIQGAGSAACDGCRAPSAPVAFQHAFQPIFDLKAGRAFGHEALVRGLNGEGAFQVLSQIDDSNRYHFDQSSRTEAVRRASELGMDEYLFINFLPNAVYKPENCIRRTLEACREHNFPENRIVFEVSESECVDNRHHLLDILRAYDTIGFKTAIDDFGSGYAGLTLLRQHQPTFLKLDMGLIRDIDKNPVAQAIARGVLGISRDMGARLIAEGVETAGERDWLVDAGVDLMQGYLLARPAFALQLSPVG